MKIAKEALKKLLLQQKVVDETTLKNLDTIADQTHDSLDEVIVKRGVISDHDLAKLYAKSIDVEYTDLSSAKVPHELLTMIPERIARKYQAVLFAHDKDGYKLAMADPEDYEAVDMIEKQLGFGTKIYAATTSDIMTLLDQYRSGLDSEINKAIKDSSDAAVPKDEEIAARDIAEDAPIAKTVNIILEYAVKSRASDVHIEPRENIVQIRYRVDGILRETMTLPRQIQAAVVSRIKILASLKLDEHRIPQDGRFKANVGSKEVAIRVSTLPVMDGEKVVMRILDESAKALTLEELGFTGHALETIVNSLKKPHGMALVTGPTGSGKSTTLYSILSSLNTPGVNISTVEDPVEYRINGVNQTQVNTKAGMTFAGGLRSLLRQDPNIIMVGEIRDSETANLAVQAALTGHTVLSTLHTNNAATCLPRLLDMNVEPFLIASTVNTVIGQRLVRRLCQKCKVAYTPKGEALEEIKKSFDVDAAVKMYKKHDEVKVEHKMEKPKPVAHEHHLKSDKKVIPAPSKEELEKKSILERIAADPNIINRSLEDKPKKSDLPEETIIPDAKPETPVIAQALPAEHGHGSIVLYAPKGCKVCDMSGYDSRLGIYEVLDINERIAQLITAKATADDIQAAAVKDGMLTMQQDGFLKALQGLTTIEEVLRVTRE